MGTSERKRRDVRADSSELHRTYVSQLERGSKLLRSPPSELPGSSSLSARAGARRRIEGVGDDEALRQLNDF